MFTVFSGSKLCFSTLNTVFGSRYLQRVSQNVVCTLLRMASRWCHNGIGGPCYDYRGSSLLALERDGIFLNEACKAGGSAGVVTLTWAVGLRKRGRLTVLWTVARSTVVRANLVEETVITKRRREAPGAMKNGKSKRLRTAVDYQPNSNGDIRRYRCPVIHYQPNLEMWNSVGNFSRPLQ